MNAVIVISSVALALYVAPLLPIVVALVTKSSASPGLKGTLLVVLAAVTALVAPAVQNGADINVDGKFLGSFVVTVLVALGAHFGLLKPTGITGEGGVVAEKVPGGLG